MSSKILPPAQPAYILRGHSAQVHSLHFTLDNQRLLTGDADGWLVSWNLAFKRPVASWKGHQKGILGIGSWGRDCIISYLLPPSTGRMIKQLIQREAIGTVEITSLLYGSWALRTKVTSRRLYPLMPILSPHQSSHGSYIF